MEEVKAKPRRSIERRIKGVILSIASLSLLISSAGILMYEYITFRQRMVNDLETTAQLIGDNSTAALAFESRKDAQDVLRTLRSQPRIVSAFMYDKNHSLFASYFRDSVSAAGAIPWDTSGARFERQRLVVFKPIRLDKSRLGTIVLESDLQAMYERFFSYGIILVIVALGSMVIAFIAASKLQRKISHPILSLAETAKTISQQHDYSIRAPQAAEDDETDLLATAINQMLTQIQERDSVLSQANESMANEITERKRAEDVLRSSEERFRLLFDNHPLPMWVYEPETLRFLEVNESAVRQYGYSREEFLQMRTTEIRPAEDVSFFLGSGRGAQSAMELSGHSKHRLKDGRVIDVEIISHQTRYLRRNAVLVVALDVTERMKAEHHLKISEERYRSLVSAITSIVWTAGPTGSFSVPQKSWERYTGQEWEKHAGFGWLNAIQAEDRPEAEGLLREAVAEKRSFEFQGKIWNAASRSHRYFIAKAVPLRDGDGSIREWIGTVTDVHDRKLAEEEIKELNEALEQRVLERTAQLETANKELEAFSYSVSHDLRAPLRSISSFSELLMKNHETSLDDEGKDFLHRVNSSSHRMAHLIDDLLNLSRLTRAEVRHETVDLGAIAKGVASELKRSQPDRDVQFVVGDNLTVHGDSRLMMVVLDNLIGNAWKYTRGRPKATIEFGAMTNNGKRVFYVKDNGAGFDMQYAGKLFGAFQRLHNTTEFEGTGIGLATVARIIRRHGGTVWAEGKVDEGATFYFSI
jgi:PAS domain S-box-containing protein